MDLSQQRPANADMLLSFSSSSIDFTSEIKNLYNGNIACMINGMPDDNMGNMSSIANVYNYDMLNRIKKYTAFTQGATNNSIFAHNMVATNNKEDKYLSNYIYDGNGNIMNLSRNGNVLGSLDMDNMEYCYSASGGTWGTIIKDNNKLYSVSDLTADGSYNDAFKQGQLVGNYDYFDNGQLKADVQEEIEEIHWNAAGKVIWIESTQAVPGTNDRDELKFKYDAMGQRRYEIEGSGPRKEFWEIPRIALKEIIINALSHRDYYDKGGRIMIEIFDDRLVVSNPGGLVSVIRPDEFGKISHSRNPLIFGLFERLDMVEQVGSGISRVRTALLKNNLPEPKFQTQGAFSVTIQRRIKVESKVISTRVKTRDKIIELIRINNSITTKELAIELGISNKGIEYHLDKLTNDGVIERDGSRKTGFWKLLN